MKRQSEACHIDLVDDALVDIVCATGAPRIYVEDVARQSGLSRAQCCSVGRRGDVRVLPGFQAEYWRGVWRVTPRERDG